MGCKNAEKSKVMTNIVGCSTAKIEKNALQLKEAKSFNYLGVAISISDMVGLRSEDYA